MKDRSMALVVRDHRILMVRHKYMDRSFFIIPGGGIEKGESPEQAAVRELKEECGLDGTVIRQLSTHCRTGGYTEYVYWVEVPEEQEATLGCDPEYGEDHQIILEVRWMALHELSEKDRAFLWAHGLMDMSDFEEAVIAWGDAISYPVP